MINGQKSIIILIICILAVLVNYHYSNISQFDKKNDHQSIILDEMEKDMLKTLQQLNHFENKFKNKEKNINRKFEQSYNQINNNKQFKEIDIQNIKIEKTIFIKLLEPNNRITEKAKFADLQIIWCSNFNTGAVMMGVSLPKLIARKIIDIKNNKTIINQNYEFSSSDSLNSQFKDKQTFFFKNNNPTCVITHKILRIQNGQIILMTYGHKPDKDEKEDLISNIKIVIKGFQSEYINNDKKVIIDNIK